MDKRYQGVIRRLKSMKDRQNNGQKIAKGNKKGTSMKNRHYPLVSFVHCFVCSSLIYPSYYPLVSFVHCFVCPSLIYAFLLSLGIFEEQTKQWTKDTKG
jgi:hypothetical protein